LDKSLGKSAVRSAKERKISTATIVVAVIVAILLLSPLIAGYVLWFKHHRTPVTEEPADIDDKKPMTKI